MPFEPLDPQALFDIGLLWSYPERVILDALQSELQRSLIPAYTPLRAWADKFFKAPGKAWLKQDPDVDAVVVVALALALDVRTFWPGSPEADDLRRKLLRPTLTTVLLGRQREERYFSAANELHTAIKTAGSAEAGAVARLLALVDGLGYLYDVRRLYTLQAASVAKQLLTGQIPERRPAVQVSLRPGTLLVVAVQQVMARRTYAAAEAAAKAAAEAAAAAAAAASNDL